MRVLIVIEDAPGGRVNAAVHKTEDHAETLAGRLGDQVFRFIESRTKEGEDDGKGEAN